jgi:hypothetical protein
MEGYQIERRWDRERGFSKPHSLLFRIEWNGSSKY